VPIKAGEFDTNLMAIVYKQLSEELRDDMLTPYVSIGDDEARVTLFAKDSPKDLRRKELLEQIRTDLIEKFKFTEDSLEITGLLVLYNNMLKSLFKSQIMTLDVAMLGIAIMLMLLILFRSFSLAVFIGIITNILTAAIILGLMGPLDLMTITIAAITIGRAAFYTAITIIFSFTILVLSNFIFIIYFGLLTALAMFIALFAALTLLPKLILMWKPFSTIGYTEDA